MIRKTRVAAIAVALVVATALWLSATARRGAAQVDYLDSELRAAVEQLKVDASRPATDTSQARERLRLLWRWMNAYALAGGAVPVDFPQQYLVEILGVRATSGRPEDVLIAAKKADSEAFLAEV